jgi:hypothetical protein
MTNQSHIIRIAAIAGVIAIMSDERMAMQLHGAAMCAAIQK